MSSVLLYKGCSFALKSHVLLQKRGFILDWKVSVLSRKRGRFELKSVLPQKGGHFQTGEQGWVPLFPVSEGVYLVTINFFFKGLFESNGCDTEYTLILYTIHRCIRHHSQAYQWYSVAWHGRALYDMTYIFKWKYKSLHLASNIFWIVPKFNRNVYIFGLFQKRDYRSKHHTDWSSQWGLIITHFLGNIITIN